MPRLSAGPRVAVVVKTNEGGRWLLPQLRALRERGHQVTVVLPAGRGRLRDLLDQQAFPVVESAFDFSFRPRRGLLAGLRGLRRQLAALEPDVVFYHLYASALAARIATLGRPVARVHMVAGPLYLDAAPIRLAERWLARLDHLVICGSAHTAGRYRALGHGPRSTTIPYGVDTDAFTPATATERGAARTELGIGPGAFVAIMAAYVYAPKRLVHKGIGIKGHDVLLRAWADFHRAHPDALLVLVGGGFDAAGRAHRADLMRRFGSRGVLWLDSVTDVRPYYAAADVSVCPSLSENHGAALESAARGLPCIVSDAGGLPETVERTSGWVVPAGNPRALEVALRRAYAEHRRGGLAARGRSGRAYVEARFDQRWCAGQVAAAIEHTAGRAGRRAPAAIFVEARFGRSAAGMWAAEDAVHGAAGWQPYADALGPLTVVARARTEVGSAAGTELGEVSLTPLPYYIGPKALLRTLVPLARAVDRAVRGASVVVVRLPGPVGTLAALACTARRRPYAVELVGDPAEVLGTGVAGRTGRLAAGAAGAVLRAQVRGATAVRYVTGRTLQRRYPPRPGAVTVGCSDVRLAEADYAVPRTGWRHPHLLVAVGSQEQAYKGHDVLLSALARLREAGTEVTARIVGDGRQHDRLVALAAELDLAGTVHFVSTVDRTALRALLDEADLCCLPSRTEGLPRVLVEAMARALPAVASAVGGVPELLDPACLVPPGDPAALAAAIGRLLGDKDEWVRQSARNLDRAGAYHEQVTGPLRQAWLLAVRAQCDPGR